MRNVKMPRFIEAPPLIIAALMTIAGLRTQQTSAQDLAPHCWKAALPSNLRGELRLGPPRCSCPNPQELSTLPLTIALVTTNSGLVAGLQYGGRGAGFYIRAAVVLRDGEMLMIGPSEHNSEVAAASDRGQVVGQVTKPGGKVPFSWSREKGFQELPLPYGASSAQAVALSSESPVVNAKMPDGLLRSFTWLGNGYKPVRGLSAQGDTAIAAANNAAQMVGTSVDEAGVQQLVLWNHDAPVILPKPPGVPGELSLAAINDRGTIVGNAHVPDDKGGATRAVAWLGEDHRPEDLDPGRVSAVNESDLAVGRFYVPGQLVSDALLWDVERGLVTTYPTPQPPEGRYIVADIDESGVAVGFLYSTGWQARRYPRVTCAAPSPEVPAVLPSQR